jgi:hypothetical protein
MHQPFIFHKNSLQFDEPRHPFALATTSNSPFRWQPAARFRFQILLHPTILYRRLPSPYHTLINTKLNTPLVSTAPSVQHLFHRISLLLSNSTNFPLSGFSAPSQALFSAPWLFKLGLQGQGQHHPQGGGR